LWKNILDEVVSQIYTSVWMEHIFSIVTDFLYRLGTVLEIKMLLEKTTSQHVELANQIAVFNLITNSSMYYVFSKTFYFAKDSNGFTH
jgi:hypothetical protein